MFIYTVVSEQILRSDEIGLGWYFESNPLNCFATDEQLLVGHIDPDKLFHVTNKHYNEQLSDDPPAAIHFIINALHMTYTTAVQAIASSGLSGILEKARQAVGQSYCGVLFTDSPHNQRIMLFPTQSPPHLSVANEPFYGFEASPDAKTIWIHCSDGSTVGRFSRFGIDLHNPVSEQIKGAPECRFCTHSQPSISDWDMFRSKAFEYWNITIPSSIICSKVLLP